MGYTFPAIIMILLAVTWNGGVAGADVLNGDVMATDITQNCNIPLAPGDSTKMFAQVYCLGYLQGAASAISHLEQLKRTSPSAMNEPLICLPPNLTNQQIIDVVRGFIAKTPATSELHGDMAVFAALREAFPCN